MFDRVMKVCIVTMGCKVNRADSAVMAARLAARGCVLTRDPGEADAFVVNTCTVTAKSDAEVRQIVRRLHRRRPAARVVVAGCLPRVAETLGPEFAPYCTHLAGPDNVGLIEALGGLETVDRRPEPALQPSAYGLLPDYGDRTRPFLKIQDGCDAACAYCIVPRARGRSRSALAGDVVAQAKALAAQGYLEIVLAGIHLGAFGKDAGVHDGLADLIETLGTLDEFRRGARVRLSSLEPLEVTPRLIDTVAAAPYVCRHFHVPLQSGSDRVLAAMNRPYRVDTYRRAAETIKGRIPGACLGADLIAGFPGETSEDQLLTEREIAAIPVDYVHVFTFSPRPGTAAAAMPGRPAAVEVKRRVAALRALGEEKRARFHRSMAGETLNAIVERRRPGGAWNALTDNYIRAAVACEGLKTGMMAAIVLGVDGDGRVTGRPV